ncbi:unnamed protein product [Urochloa decumbens]|uniref:Uncharacterized protein n=1 Tax=Urochloa decumbens TaxID=240449 RepID=A0ABC9AFW4_9POAL
MEEWRELARTVPGTLLRVAEGTIELLGTLDSAHRALAALICVALSLLRGDADAVAVNRDEVREQPDARAMLDDARRALVRLRELHDMASQVFHLCATRPTRLAPEAADALWKTWARHSGETYRHGCRALESLRSAASHARTSRDALLMVRSLPRQSPEWTAWVSASLNLLRRAVWAATKARLAARRMRDAVAVELEDASKVINR